MLSLIAVPRGTVCSIQRAAGTGLVSGTKPTAPLAASGFDAGPADWEHPTVPRNSMASVRIDAKLDSLFTRLF